MQPLPEPENDADKRLFKLLEEYGWFAIQIPADEEGPNECFSVGFFRSFGHPEVLIVGLDLTMSHQFLGLIAEEIKSGKKFMPKRSYSNLAVNLPISFVDLAKSHYKDHLGYAIWFYRGSEFPTLQMIFSDKAGNLPWEDGYSDFEQTILD